MAEIKIMTLAAQQYYDEKIKKFIADEHDKLVNGQIKTNADAIAAINDENTGILKQAKDYADGKDAAIQAAQKAGDDAAAAASVADGKAVAAQNDVDALETYVGTIPEGATATNVVAYVQEKTSGIATEGAMTELSNRVGVVEGKVATIEGDYLKAADKTELQGNIDVVSGAIERLTNGVSADEIDGVNDLIQYVKDHGAEVIAMQKDISDNADAIAAETERATGVEGGLDTRLQAVEAAVGESGSVANDIAEAKQAAIDAAAADATSKANTAEANAKSHADGLNTAMNTRVEALEAIDHDHANKAELDLIVSGDKAKWDAAQANAEATAAAALSAAKTELEGKISDGDKTNKDLIDGHTTRIEALEAKVGDGFVAVTNGEIDAMFD